MSRRLARATPLPQSRAHRAGDADGRHRLRGRVQQSRPRAGACGDFRPLGARRPRIIAPRRSSAAAPSSACPMAIRRGNIIDLFLPEAGEAAPLAIFIHGGYWRSLDPSLFSHMARGLNARGVAVAVVGYDLCPIVTIARHHRANPARLRVPVAALRPAHLVYGHSAGGHLAAAMVATDWPSLYPKAPADLVPAGYAISGVFDLAPLVGVEHEPGFAARRRRGAPRLAAVLAGRSPAACSTPSSATSNPSEFKRQSRTMARDLAARHGAKHATRRSPAPTTSPSSTRSPIRKARWSRASPNWRKRSSR